MSEWEDLVLEPMAYQRKPQPLIMSPTLYRWYCTYLAFSEAWRLYGKTLGYS